MTGLEIKKEDIPEIYRDNPGHVVIFIAENLLDLKDDVNELKNQCSCRYDNCQKEIKRSFKTNKFKNFLVQFPGGVIGGTLAVYFIFKFWLENKFGIKLPDGK
jgi:translation initiation factor 2 gamma subunit (eIF-2gamma)